MKLIELNKLEERKRINLFKEPTDSVIIAIIEGKKGRIWTDEEIKQAFAFDGIYGYLDGDVTKEFISEIIKLANDIKTMEKITIVPQNYIAKEVLEEFLGDEQGYRYEKKQRYLMAEPLEGFDVAMLQEYIASLPVGMRIESFNKRYFDEMKNDNTLEYLTESYKDYDEFKNEGTGFLILKNNHIVAGATSYSVFSEGIEVLLMTVPKYRRKGFAGIAVARLLLFCAENGLRAIWDAANPTSVAIAKKMGYSLKRKYNGYTLYN